MVTETKFEIFYVPVPYVTSHAEMYTDEYSFKKPRTICLPFAIRLSSVHDRQDATRTDWVIHSEKFPAVQIASAIHLNKIFICSNS